MFVDVIHSHGTTPLIIDDRRGKWRSLKYTSVCLCVSEHKEHGTKRDFSFFCGREPTPAETLALSVIVLDHIAP